MNSCKICDKNFDSDRGLHGHLKSHGLTMAEYYTKYFPRKNLLTGEPLPFKNKDDYFSRDFSNRTQLIKWCNTEKEDKVKDYILKLLSNRIKLKGLSVGPCYLELKINSLPTVEIYQKFFGSYTAACRKLNVEPMFGSRLPEDFKICDTSKLEIFIDTREQQPLNFAKSESLKLDFGDYAIGGDNYNYTYIDRKSEQDFKSTLSKNSLERFRNELQRAKDFDSYLFIVTESSLDKIAKNNRWGAHKSNLKYIYHNMRVLSHEFNKNCQFIFTGSRERSEELIPKILLMGKKLWNVDLQHCIDRGII